MDIPLEIVPTFTSRKVPVAIFVLVITTFLQIVVSIALYGARATANGDNPAGMLRDWRGVLNNDLLVLWLPPIVSAIVIGGTLSLAFRLNKPVAYLAAVLVSGVTWIIALTIAINNFGA